METMFVGQLLFSLNEVDSTNDFLLNKLKSESLAEGTIVVAKQQTKGKGQRGKSWLSDSNESLLLSLLLFPKCSIQKQFFLNKAIAVSICQALSTFGVNAKIKWPNDIYVENKKVSGVLIENAIHSNQLKHSVVGVGINVNQLSFPQNLPNPTSMRLCLNKQVDRTLLLEVVCSFMEKNYLLFKNNSFTQIDDQYHSLLYKHFEYTSFKIENKLVDLKVLGVSASGLLELEGKEGLKAFSMGEITFV
jgi:BirA family transcriptional regulator, biotin operon repressor / biotin---[acetyl-CoA-carboxylase] ligase